MENELFALLRLGLGNCTPEEENLSNFIMMSAAQWTRIGNLARAQCVLGIALDGIDKLEAGKYGATRDLPVSQKLGWIGEVLRIEQGNRHQTSVMNSLAQKWVNEGCRVMVMKGQANGSFYPNPEHRNPGDIDCYLFENYQLGNNIAKKAGANVDVSWYKHSQIKYKGEMFENHLLFVHTRDGKRSKCLQEELVNALQVKEWRTFSDSSVLLPPTQWNAMFLTYHACGHFLSEGLRLKQILDWAMFLKSYQDDVDWKAFYEYCDKYHFRRFTDAMTAISVYYLGVKIENEEITTESPYVEKILNSTLYDEDYIYNTGETIWRSRWHVVRSLFRYRWRYEEIYQESVWKQMWWYASGFLFRTE